MKNNVIEKEVPFPILEEKIQAHYHKVIIAILGKIIEKNNLRLPKFLDPESAQLEIPFLAWERNGKDNHSLSVMMFCEYKPNAVRFFFDMITRWLLPGKKLKVEQYFASDFSFSFHYETYLVAEVVICPGSQEELSILERNLALMQIELKMGLGSTFHAKRILEIKGLTADEKTSVIQDRIARFVQVHHEFFDYEIFAQMQHFLVLCKEEFKAARSCDHLARIVFIFCYFRKEMRARLKNSALKRHILIKVMRVKINSKNKVIRPLAFWVCINHFNEAELFDQKHLLKAVHTLIPGAEIVSESIFIDSNREDPIKILYCEIQKIEEVDFASDEIVKLRSKLADLIRGSIERLTKPVFMPRNEEEVMRNIVILSHQLRYVKDCPQVVLSFEGQTESDLIFTMVMLRVLLSKSQPTKKLFDLVKSPVHIQLEKIKKVGMLRNKYLKEASVCRVRVDSASFLRSDHSVDLYRARQAIISKLQSIFGDIRDYNGGMIAKQLENFFKLRELLGKIASQNEWFLENFFYSIFPVEMRSVVEVAPLARLFGMLLELRSRLDQPPVEWRSHRNEKEVYFAIVIHDPALTERLFATLDHFFKISPSLISTQIQTSEQFYLGYLYFQEDIRKQDFFISALEQALDF